MRNRWSLNALGLVALVAAARMAGAQCPYLPPESSGSGTISSSGATVTGTGTAFQDEIEVGFILKAANQTVAVTAIASQTSLTTSPSFAPALSGATFTKSPPPYQIDGSNCAPVYLVRADGSHVGPRLQVIGPTPPTAATGNGITPAAALHVQASPGGATTDATGDVGGTGGAGILILGKGGNAPAGSTPGVGGGYTLFAGDGGDISSGTGGTAGTGGSFVLDAGKGGTAGSGNTNGNGGHIEINAGPAGSGAGSAGVAGSVRLGNVNGNVEIYGAKAAAHTVLSTTADTSIASTSEVQLLSGSVTTRSGKTIIVTAAVKLVNSASASRSYTFQLRRGGTGCADGTAVTDGDGYLPGTGAGDRWTHVYSANESSPGGTVTYRLCAKSSSATGTQTAEYAQMTFTEL